MDDSIFDEAQAVRGLEVDGICAMGIFAARHLTPNGTMKRSTRAAIKQAWDADPMPYARAAKMRPTWFDRTTDVSKYELLAAIEIGKVKDKYARALLAEQWQATTMSYDDVRAAVQGLKQPKPREKQEKRCPFCNEVIP